MDVFDGKEGWSQVWIERDEVGIRMKRDKAIELTEELAKVVGFPIELRTILDFYTTLQGATQ